MRSHSEHAWRGMAAVLGVVLVAVVYCGLYMHPGEDARVTLSGWNAGSDKDAHSPVTYGHKQAVDEMNSFFDSLPTARYEYSTHCTLNRQTY